jgi:hypothetical protein
MTGTQVECLRLTILLWRMMMSQEYRKEYYKKITEGVDNEEKI